MAKSTEELGREKTGLEVEDLRLRVAATKRPLWKRLEVPWLIAIFALSWQVWEGNKRFVAEERKAEAERAKADKSESDVRSLLNSQQHVVARLESVEKAFTNSATQTPKAPPARSDLELQLEREAQENIRWVIQRDTGARATYEAAKASTGGNKFQAVLRAQGHNPRAQQVIRQYGEEKTVAFIDSLGG